MYKIFQDILQRKELKTDKIRSSFSSIKKPMYNIKSKIQYLKDLLFIKNIISINDLFEESNCKEELVITFLAMLELAKSNDVIIKQDEVFSKIFLERKEKWI